MKNSDILLVIPIKSGLFLFTSNNKNDDEPIPNKTGTFASTDFKVLEEHTQIVTSPFNSFLNKCISDTTANQFQFRLLFNNAVNVNSPSPLVKCYGEYIFSLRSYANGLQTKTRFTYHYD